jgi:hypothetical protein
MFNLSIQPETLLVPRVVLNNRGLHTLPDERYGHRVYYLAT